MFHTTQTGERVLISDMENDHLENTIKYYINTIKDLNKLYFGEVKENINTIVAGYKNTVSKERIREMIQNNSSKLALFILEGQIRGNDYKVILQDLYERKGRTNIMDSLSFSNNLLGSGGVEEGRDDEMPF